MRKTENLGLIKPEGNDYYNVEVQNQNSDILDKAIGGKAEKAWVENRLNQKLEQGSGELSQKTTVLEAALSVSVGTTIFAVGVDPLLHAPDGPTFNTAQPLEMQYIVLMDYTKTRRTILAIPYLNGDYCMWIRTIYESHWLTPQWTRLATSKPSKEIELILKEGIPKIGSCVYLKTQDQMVTLNMVLQLPVQGDVKIGTLPPGFRPSHTMVCAASNADYLAIDIDGSVRCCPTTTKMSVYACITFLATQ